MSAVIVLAAGLAVTAAATLLVLRLVLGQYNARTVAEG